jgi:hypothetical protein
MQYPLLRRQNHLDCQPTVQDSVFTIHEAADDSWQAFKPQYRLDWVLWQVLVEE